MRRIIFSILFIILLISPISAEIILNGQPQDVYNLGDIVAISTTIKAVGDTSGIYQMDLLCEESQINFYKNGVSLLIGEEENFDASIVLVKEMIGELRGDCKIKATLGENYLLTEKFEISDSMTMQIDTEEREFAPNEYIIIEGSAIKENTGDVNGFIDAEILITGESSSENLLQSGTINNGFFSLEILAPSDMKAGSYLIKLNAYEKDTQEEITNNGFLDYNIAINQVPTNLEIITENQEVEPGTNLVLKTILHDQTGESINSNSYITIEDDQNLVMEQTEISTEETLEYEIKYNTPPAKWKVSAESNELTTKLYFTIIEKPDINVEVINKTVIVTNTGNVFYNKTILVKIGEESLNIYANLDIDESKKYVLNAPDGEYPIEIITQEGNELSKKVTLTGKAIGIREAQGEYLRTLKSPFVWIFLIIVLGIVAFIILKKVRKKSFLGHETNFKKKERIREPKDRKLLVKSANIAELSLSIKGDKQDASVTCLKIKNLGEIESEKGSAKEILQNLGAVAEEHKASVYESQENIFFILAPSRTKTYKNGKASVQISQTLKQILSEHNKTSNQKIDFGISLNHGAIIAKQEGSILKFMSIGTLITAAKKIASLAKREVLLSGKINEKLKSHVKTEKQTRNKVPIYTIQHMKKGDEESKKFISSFLKRIENTKED